MAKIKTQFIGADKLIPVMAKLFKASDEIDIAVMFAKQSGFRLIEKYLMKALQKNAKIRILLGKDFLLTDTDVLKKLNKISAHYSNLCVRIFLTKGKFAFHPKIYAFRSGQSSSVILGSSNLSKSGFSKNIEANILTQHEPTVKKIKSYYKYLFKNDKEGGNSLDLEASFIADYEKAHKKMKKAQKKSKEIYNNFTNEIKRKMTIRIQNRKKLISDALKFTKTKDYKDEIGNRELLIKEWKEKLDMPLFQNITKNDWHSLYCKVSLGRLRAKWGNKLWSSREKLLRRLRYICNDNLPIEKRIDYVLCKKRKLDGLNIATITKILTIYDPEQYGVSNDRVKGFMENYGVSYPRGISDGSKYKLWLCFLRQIIDECGYKNFADIDYFIWKYS